MKNVTELRTSLSEIFEKLKAGEIDHNDAAQYANLAGKMISSAKVQLDYYAMRKQDKAISFLEDTSDGPAK